MDMSKEKSREDIDPNIEVYLGVRIWGKGRSTVRIF